MVQEATWYRIDMVQMLHTLVQMLDLKQKFQKLIVDNCCNCKLS